MKSPRGEMVDIGGRRLHTVRAGPASSKRPLIFLEHGAFGCAADWAVVQERLAAKGLRSLAYDRAGLGHSDPGPKPRDGRAIVSDMAALLRELDEDGPMVVVGHSMGGLTVRLFALTHPQRVLGLVLVDAVVPDVMRHEVRAGAVRTYGRLMRMVSLGARYGLMRPVAQLMGDHIGLEGLAKAEKRHIYGLSGHAHWSAEEVAQWPTMSEQAGAAELPPDLPIAAVTAGAETAAPWLKALQSAPAIASRHGYIEHVPKAGHASLLGRRFADPIVRGVEHVLAAVRR